MYMQSVLQDLLNCVSLNLDYLISTTRNKYMHPGMIALSTCATKMMIVSDTALIK